MALTAGTKLKFDKWLTGDMKLAFICRFTLADATKLYAQASPSPGQRLVTNHVAVPNAMRLPSIQISVWNARFGEQDRGRDLWEPFRIGRLTLGELQIVNENDDENGAGWLNAWADGTYIWSDADCELAVGELNVDSYDTGAGYPGDFEVFLPFKILSEPSWEMGGPGNRLISFETGPASVDLTLPANDAVFAGTGGLEGTAETEGMAKPRAYGGLSYIKPVNLGDASNNRYMVDPAGINSLPEVYEQGLEIGTDHVTATLGSGYFDIDAVPSGEILCDVTGQKFNAGAYDDDAADIAEEMVETLWSGALDKGTFDTDSGSYASGIYLDPEANMTREQALSFIIGPLGICYPEQGTGSELHIQWISKPEDETAAVAFNGDHIRVVQAVRTPVIWEVAVGYKERRTVENSNNEVMTEIEVQSRPRSLVKTSDSAVQTNYPNARSVYMTSPAAAAAGASAWATEALGIFKVERRLYRVELTRKPMDAWIGEVASLERSDFPGLSSATNTWVVGAVIDLEARRFERECWG